MGFLTKDFLKLVVCLLLGGLIITGWNKVIEWKTAADLSEQQTRTAGTTIGILGDNSRSAAESQADQNQLSQGVQQFTITIEEGQRNDPEARARADRPVPDSVRNAFRERRLARERSGCIGAGCRAEPDTNAPSKR